MLPTLTRSPKPSSSRLSAWEHYSGCRRRPVRVRLWIGGLTGPDDQHDPTDDRDQRQQHPPAGAADVMQTAHGYGEAGDNRRHAEDAIDGAYILRLEQQNITYASDEAADNQEQDEIPVRRTRRAALEVEVVSEPSCDRLPESHGSLPSVTSRATRHAPSVCAHARVPIAPSPEYTCCTHAEA